jgi:hypothetical protein
VASFIERFCEQDENVNGDFGGAELDEQVGKFLYPFNIFTYERTRDFEAFVFEISGLSRDTRLLRRHHVPRQAPRYGAVAEAALGIVGQEPLLCGTE